MAPPNSALFVIDIQHDLAGDPKTEIPHAARIRDAGEVILSAARGISQTEGAQPPLIVFVQHEEAPEEGPLVKGSDPWKLVFEPQTNNSREILVPKTTRDTFKSNPGLAEQLKAQGIEHIVAFGVQSDCCVFETSKGALEAGFRLTLLQGAHSTYDSKEGTALEIETSIEDSLRALGAKIVQFETAVGGWKETGNLDF
ncbi:Isochorismatase domain-containing protein [Fusarium falciforme]|uniref:Isochorismatase domain-containing protein n=1 Tax=Fusarium falciforme TaxID=195108 RepID=UPI002301D7E0|nr:Isochorismatase domain-containing protein [Fusarium falciforme]WAO87772.1 Isochorismatase domain-containing protein [Fusarium falciforme]